MWTIIGNRDVDIIGLLAEYSNVEAIDAGGNTAAILASQQEREAVLPALQILIKHGADLNHPNRGGMTAAFYLKAQKMDAPNQQ